MAGSKVGSTAAGLAKGFWSSFLTQALSWCPGELEWARPSLVDQGAEGSTSTS